MKIYIPALGDALIIEKPWTFDLYLEYRNSAAWEKWTGNKIDGGRWSYRSGETHEKVTLPKGDKLIVDRIYIKKGSPNYNSVTFRHYSEGQKKNSTRFWVKLRDVNKLEAEPFTEQIKEKK